jgi:hypothetical protein
MKQIRIIKREGHALSQDVVDCVSALKAVDIWAHAQVLDYGEWRTIDVISEPPQALAILRGKGFEVEAGEQIQTLPPVAILRSGLSKQR